MGKFKKGQQVFKATGPLGGKIVRNGLVIYVSKSSLLVFNHDTQREEYVNLLAGYNPWIPVEDLENV